MARLSPPNQAPTPPEGKHLLTFLRGLQPEAGGGCGAMFQRAPFLFDRCGRARELKCERQPHDTSAFNPRGLSLSGCWGGGICTSEFALTVRPQ